MSSQAHSQFFRANAGCVVLGGDGRVLVLERSDIPGAWQLPQGGIDNNETPLQAAERELFEETGLTTKDVELVAEYPQWLTYELPAELRKPWTGRGQTQRWFMFRLKTAETAILPAGSSQEFMAWRWMTFTDLIEGAVAFRKSTYRQLADWAAPIHTATQEQ